MNGSNKTIKYPEVTRIEIISDKEGRFYTHYGNKNEIEISFQDSGKTMKIFINGVK